MAENTGTKLAAEIVTPDSADNFALVDDQYIRGSFRVVADTAGMVAIPVDRRKFGMRVYIQDIQKLYELKSGVVDTDIANNSNFTEVSSGVKEWNAEDTFAVGSLVYSGTTLYLCLTENTDDNPTLESGNWEVVGFSNDLAEDNMWQGNASGKAASIPTDQQYIDNVGDIVLTQGYLYTNYPTAKLGQIVESSFQKATKEQSDWSIIKKHPKYLLQQIIDLSDTAIYNVETGTLDVSDFIGADIINFQTTVPTSFTVTNVVLNATDPVKITLSNADVKFLKNNDIIRIGGVVGTVELNHDTNGNIDFTIANIDYTAGGAIFELAGTDSSAFTAYTSGGTFTFANQTYEPIIDKIIGLPSKWEMGFAAHGGENIEFRHYDESVATTNQLVSNTNNNVIVRGSDTLREMVSLSRNDGINVLYLPYSQNIKEQNLSSHLEELTLAGPTHTFDIDKARRFFITLTGAVDFTIPTLDKGTSVVFTADITGAFAFDVLNGTIIGTYDGSIINRVTFDVYRKFDGTQAGYVTIENIVI